MNIDLMTRNILKQTLSHNTEQLYALKREVLDMSEYYIAAAPGTSQEDWEAKQFDVYVDQKKALIAFLTRPEAEAFVRRQNCSWGAGALPIVSIDSDAFAKLTAQYAARGAADSVKVYARAPIGLAFAPSDFNRGGQSTAFLSEESRPKEAVLPKSPDRKSMPASLSSRTEVPVASRVFLGVDEVRTALETYERHARRKLDKGVRFENIHTLIQSLAQQNGIDPADLDNILGLTSGYTRRFFIDVKTLDPSIEVMRKYLSYFGLEGYLFIFKSNSKELTRYLSAHKLIDKYRLKSPPSASAERFRLEKIQRGTDKDYPAAYVYKACMISNLGNSIEVIVSNPLEPAPLIIGKEYQLMHRDGRPRDEDAVLQKITAAAALPSEADMQAILAQLDEKDAAKKNKSNNQDNPRSYEEARKDEVIRYFRKQGLDGRSASAKYKDLEVEEDILDAFYKYIQSKQFGKLEVSGYTPRKLIKEMHMEPYEAFLSLVQLRVNPQETKQRLIYRERNPQYQKPQTPEKTADSGKTGKKRGGGK